MRLKLDENIHPAVAVYLRQEGHDVDTVADEGLRGASDFDVIQACGTDSRALLTLDLDFVDIRVYPPEKLAGIIVLRLASQSRIHLLTSIARILPVLSRNSLSGHLWIIDENNARVRGG